MCLGWAASAQLILLDNDFSSCTPGNYNGQTGQSLGTATTLGNATGIRNNQQVQSSGGVGNSASYVHSQDAALRSRSTHDIASASEPIAQFSVYFQFNPVQATYVGGFLGLGWALSSATDNSSPYSGGSNDRLMVGLRRAIVGGTSLGYVCAADRFANFSSGRDIPASYLSAQGVELVVGQWYQLSFELQFNYNSGNPPNSTWTLSSLALRDWGSDGQTGGTVLISQVADYTWNPDTGNNLDSSHLAYAYVAANGDRGAQRLDNVYVAVIPEPSGAALLGFAGMICLVFRRGRRGTIL